MSYPQLDQWARFYNDLKLRPLWNDGKQHSETMIIYP